MGSATSLLCAMHQCVIMRASDAQTCAITVRVPSLAVHHCAVPTTLQAFDGIANMSCLGMATMLKSAMWAIADGYAASWHFATQERYFRLMPAKQADGCWHCYLVHEELHAWDLWLRLHTLPVTVV
jgi:hypothetical protein